MQARVIEHNSRAAFLCALFAIILIVISAFIR